MSLFDLWDKIKKEEKKMVDGNRVDEGRVVPYGEGGLALDYTKPVVEETPKLLRCSTCGQMKPEIEFHKASGNCRGRVYSCKQCARLNGQAYWKSKKARTSTRVSHVEQSGNTRTCGRCKTTFPMSEFKKNLYYCQNCKREYDREYTARLRSRRYNQKYREKKRKELGLPKRKYTRRKVGRPRSSIPSFISEPIKPVMENKGILQEVREIKERLSRLEKLLG
jgi:hypothetical protein